MLLLIRTVHAVKLLQNRIEISFQGQDRIVGVAILDGLDDAVMDVEHLFNPKRILLVIESAHILPERLGGNIEQPVYHRDYDPVLGCFGNG